MVKEYCRLLSLGGTCLAYTTKAPRHKGTRRNRMDGQYVDLLGVFVSWWLAL